MFSEEIYERIERIKEDKRRGASELAVEALYVIEALAEKTEDDRDERFFKGLKKLKQLLLKVRPEMTPIASNVIIVAGEILKRYKSHRENLREFISSVVEHRIREYKKERKKTIEQAVALIEEKDTIMTCSYSSTIRDVFQKVAEEGEKVRITVAESKFQGREYGKVMLNKLNLPGYKLELAPDDILEQYFPGVDKVMVGADSVLIDGSLINGVPTLLLARIAGKLSVPFYSVCEKVKFDLLGKNCKEVTMEPGFDLVPSELVTAFVTEEGLILPGEVATKIKAMKGTRWTRGTRQTK